MHAPSKPAMEPARWAMPAPLPTLRGGSGLFGATALAELRPCTAARLRIGTAAPALTPAAPAPGRRGIRSSTPADSSSRGNTP